MLAEVGQGVRIITKDAEEIEQEKIDMAEENYDLKEDLADFSTLHQIDMISAMAAAINRQVEEKDKEISEKINELRISGEEDDVKSDSKLEDEISYKKIDAIRSSNIKRLDVDVMTTAKIVSDKISEIVGVLAERYMKLDEGDKRLDSILGEISEHIHVASRRRTLKLRGKQAGGGIPGNIFKELETSENLNVLIIDKVKEMNLNIDDQICLLHDKKHYLDLLNEATTFLFDEHGFESDLNHVRDDLRDFELAVAEKDDFLDKKYEKMEDFVENVEKIRSEALKARHELERIEEESSKHHLEHLVDSDTNDAIEDLIQYADKKTKSYIAEVTEDLQLQVEEQSDYIEELFEDVQKKSKEIKGLEESRHELLQRCESCRSSANRAKSKILKLFGKEKDRCDFV